MKLGPALYEQPVYVDPAFPLILHADRLDEARRSIYTNWHTGVELLFCLEGSAHMLLDSQTVRFKSGEIAVIGSNILHTIYADSPVCTYYCLIVEPDFLVHHGFDPACMHASAVVDDAESLSLFEQIVEECQTRPGCYKPAVLSMILRLFVTLVRGGEMSGMFPRHQSVRNYPQIIRQALDYIREHLSKTISIDDICRHVGMSKYYFCHTFRAYTGTAVLRYINVLRCDYARMLILENGYNVTEAAHQLGINNPSYFSRLYKQHMGMLPSSLRPPKKGARVKAQIRPAMLMGRDIAGTLLKQSNEEPLAANGDTEQPRRTPANS